MQPGDVDSRDTARGVERTDAVRPIGEIVSSLHEPSSLHDLVGVGRGEMPPFHYEQKGDGTPLWVFVKEGEYLTYLVGYNVSQADQNRDDTSHEDPLSSIANAEVLDLAAFPDIRVPADKLSQLVQAVESTLSGTSVVVIEPGPEDGRHPRILSNIVAELHYRPSHEADDGAE